MRTYCPYYLLEHALGVTLQCFVLEDAAAADSADVAVSGFLQRYGMTLILELRAAVAVVVDADVVAVVERIASDTDRDLYNQTHCYPAVDKEQHFVMNILEEGLVALQNLGVVVESHKFVERLPLPLLDLY